ncbi:MAG: maleylpyruvate isomerase family mycothiol-dependent enzyme [Actinomycetota bacterium]|nr:maleylpyruvate isomerase family mycothiol-dependent enzyme [Actinomycetota bacterium]
MTAPTSGAGELLADLLNERARLLELLCAVPEADWRTRPSTGGWTVADHVIQLALLDEAACLAVTAPQRFATHARARLGGGPSAPGDVDAPGSRPAPSLLRWLGRTQCALVNAYRTLDSDHRLPWYGTELDAGTALAARLTETWAHGWDLAEALGAGWPATDRLWHVADLGFRTLGASFELLGRPVPTVPVRIALTAPGGALWTWGREHARDEVTGAAEDLCLVLTGRRDIAEVPLRVTGAVVGEWLAIGRAYPGAPDAPATRRATRVRVF